MRQDISWINAHTHATTQATHCTKRHNVCSDTMYNTQCKHDITNRRTRIGELHDHYQSASKGRSKNENLSRMLLIEQICRTAKLSRPLELGFSPRAAHVHQLNLKSSVERLQDFQILSFCRFN
mmetsp:Transcript_8383/g.14096  ORF Transcript_8383/g.14096 Transcript_8383/m.14096 type:complete len:123 (+) Transcript_8383:11-379(+)